VGYSVKEEIFTVKITTSPSAILFLFLRGEVVFLSKGLVKQYLGSG
jgi:hypothetical protein